MITLFYLDQRGGRGFLYISANLEVIDTWIAEHPGYTLVLEGGI
jgi:hypothetical protein